MNLSLNSKLQCPTPFHQPAHFCRIAKGIERQSRQGETTPKKCKQYTFKKCEWWMQNFCEVILLDYILISHLNYFNKLNWNAPGRRHGLKKNLRNFVNAMNEKLTNPRAKKRVRCSDKFIHRGRCISSRQQNRNLKNQNIIPPKHFLCRRKNKLQHQNKHIRTLSPLSLSCFISWSKIFTVAVKPR